MDTARHEAPAGQGDHGGHAEHGHAEHGHAEHGHGDHVAMFRQRFWWSLLLTVPMVVTSHMVMDWFGIPGGWGWTLCQVGSRRSLAGSTPSSLRSS